MSDQGPPPPPPPYGAQPTPPPPPPSSPPPPGDPATGGLVRTERPGWSLLYVALSAVAMVVALFLPGWAEAKVLSEDVVATDSLYSVQERPGLFSAIDTVKDVRSGDPAASDPGAVADLFYPWGAVVLTALCVLVALVAAWGLRRRVLTNVARLAGFALPGVALALAAVALVSLGVELGEVNEAEGASSVDAAAPGLALWVFAALNLGVAAAVGPRIVQLLPNGERPPLTPPPPGPWHPDGGWTGGDPRVGVVQYCTHVGAVLTVALGALLCFAGYAGVSWTGSGDTVTFSDIGEAARDGGASDAPFAEAYFGWLGWLVLLWALVVVLLVVLGLKPTGVKPQTVRPILLVGSLGALAVHAIGVADLDIPDPGPAVFLVGLGLLATTVGSLLPLSTNARQVWQQQQWRQSQSQPPPPPPPPAP